MTLLPAFVRYELRTQLKSSRFIGVAAAYVVLCSVPAVIVMFLARRATFSVGGATYSSLIDWVQPAFTSLAAAAIAIDAISRERDEGSLGVVSLAPLSAAGYVLRRWCAVLFILIPLTLIPRLIGYALAAVSVRPLPSPEPFLFGWINHALPAAVIISALALALGTITGRTVLALVATFLIFTFGVDMMNNVLAYTHRNFEGIGDLINIDGARVDRLVWIVRGYGGDVVASEAGEDRRAEMEYAAARAALPFAIAMPLLGISAMYVRRSRPDLRPWRIPEKHQLRSFLRTLNRVRDEYAPDATREWPDRLAVIGGLLIAAGTIAWLVQRHDTFVELATQRYEGEKENAPTTPIAVVPISAMIRGDVRGDGSIQTLANLDVRNTGTAPVPRLVFAVNPGLEVAGPATTRKAWNRIEVDLQPPLAPSETRRLSFSTSGTPASYVFPLWGSSTFEQKFRHYLRATEAIDLRDFSRSQRWRRASPARFALSGTDLMPVLRYTPWKIGSEETVAPEVPLSVDVGVPAGLRAVDSCGELKAGRLRTKCRTALTRYALYGTRMETMALDRTITLAHLPAHRALARTHAPSLTAAVALARQAWPRVPLPERLVFFERPTGTGESRYRYRGYRPENPIVTSGRLVIIPELIFIDTRPIETREIASGLLFDALRRQRRTAAGEKDFFYDFYTLVALTWVGGRKGSAIIPPVGDMAPDTNPLLTRTDRTRLSKVMADVEYRVGSERLFQAVDDFVFAGATPGTARELLDAIERRSGVDLDRVYADYFTGSSLPVLTLKDVRFARAGAQWEVSGSVTNLGTGESFCPIVLRTAGGPLRQTVRVDSKESVTFRFLSDHEPRTLQLDPEHVCYRYAQIGTVDSIDYRGES